LAAKHRVYEALSRAFLRSRQPEVHAMLQRLADDHDVSLPEHAAREFCGYDELRALRAGGAEIGCHSVTHPLFLHEPAAEVRRELEDSRRALEHELGAPVNHLAYPYGKPDHVGARDFQIAAELGFASATTTRKGALFPAHARHRHALPRIEVTPTYSDSADYLQTIVSGLPLILRNRGRRAIVD
jgi:peptidoglycan/xylan/chitin deacetylase (PgdA/CDA1 family)